MDCPKCGEPLESGAVFCGNCGQHLAAPAPPTAILEDDRLPAVHGSENRASLGLILSIIALPASLIPILGFALGLTGLILGTIARKHYKKTSSTLAIIFGITAILLSIGLWVYVVQHP